MKKYRLHWSVHPEKTKEWYEQQCKRRSEDNVAKELDINYALSVSGKVFGEFKTQRHVVTNPFTVSRGLPVYRIWDFGKTNCILYGQIDQYGRRRLLHERVLGKPESPSNFNEQLRVALTDSKRLFDSCHFVDICDPAGSYDDHRGASTEVDQLHERGIYPEYRIIKELPTNVKKKRGRELLRADLQATPNGGEAFQLYCSVNNDAGCPVTKRALSGAYAYRKDTAGNITDKIDEKHPYEDVIDCLIYWYLETDGFLDYQPGMEDVMPVFNNEYVNPYTGF